MTIRQLFLLSMQAMMLLALLLAWCICSRAADVTSPVQLLSTVAREAQPTSVRQVLLNARLDVVLRR